MMIPWFISITVKFAVSFLFPVPFQGDVCSLRALYLGSGIESCENNATSYVQPLISDLNAHKNVFD